MSRLDALRFALADALYLAEGRYGALEGRVRYLPARRSTWAGVLLAVRAEVVSLHSAEHDEDRRAACITSLGLVDQILGALGAAPVAEAA